MFTLPVVSEPLCSKGFLSLFAARGAGGSQANDANLIEKNCVSGFFQRSDGAAGFISGCAAVSFVSYCSNALMLQLHFPYHRYAPTLATTATASSDRAV